MSVNTVSTSNKLQTPDSSDGFLVFPLSTSLGAFYGATPVVQPKGAAQALVVDTSGGTATPATGITTITGTYNSTILANAIATIAAQTNAIQAALVTLGLMKGSS